MGHQFIRQPDGKWAIWSSVVDDFISLNCEPWDLFAIEAHNMVERNYCDHRQEVDSLLDPNGKRWDNQMTWEEALDWRRLCAGHGPPDPDELDVVLDPNPDFKADPLEGSAPAHLEICSKSSEPKPPVIENIEDYFRAEFMYLTSFYWRYKERVKKNGYKEPPFHCDNPKLIMDHYRSLHNMFKQGRLTNPLCPHCKEIVEEKGQICDACRIRNGSSETKGAV